MGVAGHVAPRDATVNIPASYINVTANTRTVTSVASVNSTAFTVGSDQCTGQQVPPGGSCALTVTFTPQAGGESTAQLVFFLDDNTNLVIPLDGVGTTTYQPGVTFGAQSPLTFGSQPSTTQSPNPYRSYRLLQITNSGRAPLVCDFSNAADIEGANAADFQFVAGDLCSSTSPVQPGGSIVFQFRFQAQTSTIGTRGAVYYFHYFDASNNPQQASISLQGDVTDPSIGITSMQLNNFRTDFGTLEVGQSITSHVVIRNWGNTNLYLGLVHLSGLNANDFVTDHNCDSATITPGTYCDTYITFRPTRAGYRYAILTADCSASCQSGNTAYLSGTGFGEGVISYNYSGTQASYGTEQPTTAGTQLSSNVQQTGSVTITNTGTGTIGSTSAVISNDGGTVVSHDGGSLITDNGGGIVAAGAGNLVSDNGLGLISEHGAGIAPLAVQPHTTYPSQYVGDFTLTTCQNKPKLEPGDSCTIAVRFAPTGNGAQPATLNLPLTTVNSAHTGTTTTSVTVPLTGDGVVAPKITSVPPGGGAAAGGSSLTISGTGFSAGTTVYFGLPGGPNGITPTSVTATSLTLTTPALNPGDYDVTAVTADGHASNAGRYHVLPANFMPTLPPHATGAPVMGSTPIPLPTPHPTSPPMPGGPMPTSTPLPQPIRH